MKLSSCPSQRSPMDSLQHQHFWLMRRWFSRLLGSCVGATTHGLLSTLLFCIYLLWSGLRRDNTTGEVFICRPEEAKQSIEWNPKSYGLLRPGHFIRRHEAKHVHIHIYTKKKWNINMRTCICDFIRCWPDSQLPRWELHVRVNVNACKFSPCAMHAKPKPPKVWMRACKTDRHTCKMAISLLSHLNGNIYLGKVNKRKWGQTRMQWTSFLWGEH